MITAKDELRHLADNLTQTEAEVLLHAPEMWEACKALLALVDPNPRVYQYDSQLQAVVDQVRAAVEGLREGELVDQFAACPACDERRLDRLAWDADGEQVRCGTCGHSYEPGSGPDAPSVVQEPGRDG